MEERLHRGGLRGGIFPSSPHRRRPSSRLSTQSDARARREVARGMGTTGPPRRARPSPPRYGRCARRSRPEPTVRARPRPRTPPSSRRSGTARRSEPSRPLLPHHGDPHDHPVAVTEPRPRLVRSERVEDHLDPLLLDAQRDTLVKAVGSIRRTRASSVSAPPQLSTRAEAPARPEPRRATGGRPRSRDRADRRSRPAGCPPGRSARSPEGA